MAMSLCHDLGINKPPSLDQNTFSFKAYIPKADYSKPRTMPERRAVLSTFIASSM
jgi:hypothetical protein